MLKKQHDNVSFTCGNTPRSRNSSLKSDGNLNKNSSSQNIGSTKSSSALKLSNHTASSFHEPKSASMETAPQSRRARIREIRWLKCSCVGNIGLVERTEDVMDALKDYSVHCGANLLAALPYHNKKKSRASIGERSDLLKTCLGYTGSYDLSSQLSDSPPYQRRRTLSDTGIPNNINKNQQQPQKPRLTLAQCVELSKLASAKEQPVPRVGSAGLSSSGGTSLSNRGSINNAAWEGTDDLRHTASPTASRRSFDPRDYSSALEHRFSKSVSLHTNDSISSDVRITIDKQRRLVPRNMKSNSGKKPVRVHLLTGESILLVFDAKAHVKEVFDQVCALHSIKEGHFFGLSAIIEKEHRFMDLKQRLSKYAPKEWGKEHRRKGSDLSIQPSSVFTVQFQVQYYVEHPKLICNHQSRQHYYLQLKRNVLQSKVSVQDETIFTLAATALHLDLGPFDPAVHTGQYFDPHEYVPAWFVKKWDETYLWSHLPTLHAELVSTSAFNAQADYIKRASTIDDVPVHYYKLFKTKKETEPSVILGIYNQGIRVHHVAQQRLDGPHLLDFEFPWNKVGRLFFAAKRFEIYPEDLPSSRRLTYFTGSHSRSKYLLRMLRETHSLFMSLTPFVQHMRKIDGKNTKRMYRESYISGMNLEERLIGGVEERLVGGMEEMSPGSNKSKEERVKFFKSYNSSTSHGSSHTSGIESDSKQRPEEIDEDEADDNAFVDDFDPIELDGPPSGGVIYITQEHLEGPQHKSLSVTDLTESPSAKKKSFSQNLEQESSSTSQSEQTLHNENVDCPATVEEDKPLSSHAVTVPVETHFDFQYIDDSEGLLLHAKSKPSKLAQLKDSGYIDHNLQGASNPRTHQRSASLIPQILDNFPDVPNNSVSYSASHDILPTTSNDQRPVQPAPLLGRKGSKTYYDDTNTFPSKQRRVKSTDADAKYGTTPRQTSLRSSGNSARENRKSGSNRRHRKQVSRDEDPSASYIHRSYSTDSALRQQQQVRHKHSQSKPDAASSGHRHPHPHRLESMPDARGRTEGPDVIHPDGRHFGAALSANKSYDDLSSPDSVLLSRSDRRHDIPRTLSVEEPDPMQSRIHQYPAPQSAPSTSRAPQAKDAEIAAVNHRKMSDACHKTMAAQHRQMSETRVHHHHHHHHHGHRRRSDAERPADFSKQNGHAVGAPGYTPRKPAALLRTKNDRSNPNRPRPVSYHMMPDRNHASCFSDAALTSRPPVYIESFKEVIV